MPPAPKKPAPRRKKTTQLKKDPWDFPEFSERDVRLVQSIANGTATPEMQRDGFKWIVEIACATYDMSYRPGEDGKRDTDFAEGKRHVGNTLVRMTKILLKSFNQPSKE